MGQACVNVMKDYYGLDIPLLSKAVLINVDDSGLARDLMDHVNEHLKDTDFEPILSTETLTESLTRAELYLESLDDTK